MRSKSNRILNNRANAPRFIGLSLLFALLVFLGVCLPVEAATTPASITVPAADADGSYLISWGASSPAGATYILEEATNSTFTAGLRAAYTGTATSANITGRSQNVTYYYRVKARATGYPDSAYREGAVGCAVPGTLSAGIPVSLTVPVADIDGAYTVSWGASATTGVTYELQEATNSNFSTGLRLANRGTATTFNVTGRSQNVTYYYRVRAVKAGLKDSGYRTGSNSCAVPGGTTAGVPASITVPAADADGVYIVSWGASATAGVTYELQEATSSNFSTGLWLVYRGTARTSSLTGRSQNKTYYYRVRAVKAGLKDSGYRIANNSCAVPGTSAAVAPVSLTVPVADADGVYAVSWGTSATAGVTYELQEATDSIFSTGLRTAFTGLATTCNITGRSQNVTYYYRVRSMKGGLKDSGYRVGVNGCAVPGASAAGSPAGVTVPAENSYGAYPISWTASTTAGVIYELQEATNSAFTVGLRLAYRGTATSFDITGRTAGITYFYRVRAVRPGYQDSSYRLAGNGCRIWPKNELVSRSPDDSVLGSDGKYPVLSASGRYVAFTSTYALAPGAVNGQRQVFFRDRQTDQIVLVSRVSGANGAEGNVQSKYPEMSGDGRYVIFESDASNLVPNDTNAFGDIFLRDLQTQTTTRVSVGPGGVQANGRSQEASISADGRYVAFFSYADNLAATTTNKDGLVYVRDMQTGTTTVVSVATDGAFVSGHWPSLSADGSRIAFWSYSNKLVTGDTNGVWDIFVYDRNATPKIRLVSVASDGTQQNQGGNGSSSIERAFISGDGDIVAFPSRATNLVADDFNGKCDVFIHQISSGQTIRASVGSSGEESNGDSPQWGGQRLALTYDGGMVVFTTNASNIASGGTRNILAHDNFNGGTAAIVDSTLFTSGEDGPAISGDGRFVAFGSQGKLDPRFASGSGIFVQDPYAPD